MQPPVRTPEADDQDAPLQAHAGTLAVSAAATHGVAAMFTLSGAHIFPLLDATKAVPGVRLVDVRHEQTAVFAAEAVGKLTRRPGLAAVTAGPGVTNSISGVAQAQATGVPLLVLGGRAPAYRWGSGALQEIDHPPLLEPVTKSAVTVGTADETYAAVDEALRVAAMPHRGPTFIDVPMDQLYTHATAQRRRVHPPAPLQPDADAVRTIAGLLARADRPVLVLGTDVWMDGADAHARAFVEATAVPVIANGMGRGILPAGHPGLVTKARGTALAEADLVIVAGTPLDFRLQYGLFGDQANPTPVVHLADAPSAVATHVPLAASAAGSLAQVFAEIQDAWEAEPRRAERRGWSERLAEQVAAAQARDDALLTADSPGGIHPARVYGALLPLLTDDTIVIGDGGDFVSWAGRFIEPNRPGHWLDPGPYGCLGAGPGAAIGAGVVRPSSPRVLLLGDGAAGFSLAELETLVRHDLPTLVVVGNNGIWGLEKHPMRFLYGYDVAADLRRDTRYDAIAEAMGGAGETVADPDHLTAALTRGLESGQTYVVNTLLDPEVAYPRKTGGV